ncbi:MAG: hypothetical protein AAFR61_07875 [Bacteroidota bacterium]
MSTPELYPETLVLLAQYAMRQVGSEGLVKWAVTQLQTGLSSPSLEILAGLDHEATEVRELYFWQAVEEVGMEIPREEAAYLQSYAREVARTVVAGEENPQQGLAMLKRIAYHQIKHPFYMEFLRIQEDIDVLINTDFPSVYGKVNSLDEVDAVIRAACRRFIEGE